MKYLLITLFTFTISFAQSPKRMLKKLGNNPVLFIDSVNVERAELQKYDSKDISAVTMIKEKEAIQLIGPDGKDGAVYIETTTFCKKRYMKYFSSKSSKYNQLINSNQNDNNIQYILNKRILKEQFEGDLAAIDDKLFKSITFITKEELIKKYEITDKDYGFLITSETPENLYHGNRKF